MGFEHWEVGFRKKMGWEMGLVPPLQDPLLILIRSTIPVISGDFLTRWNAITVGKGRGSEGKKGQF